MAPPSDTNNTPLDTLRDALKEGVPVQVRYMLNTLPPADVALLLESSPPKTRNLLWQLLEPDQEHEVLNELSEEVASYFLEKMDAQELIAFADSLETDDLANVLQQLPDTITDQVMASLDSQRRHRLEGVLSYEEDTAGGLMNTDTVTVRPNNTLDVVLRYLRVHRELPDMTDSLLVVNRKDDLIGVLPITKILVTDPSITVREVMLTETITIPVDMLDTEVAKLFERHDLVSAPVVDEKGKLLGRITIDDVVDVIREEGERSLMSMGGLTSDEDTFAPVITSARSRAIWLGINLATAFLASSVIGLFQHTINQVVALAVLMPIVASMGGIAGSQTLTIVIRGMALGHIERSNARWLLLRELSVGILNGLLWAAVIAAAAMFWFDDKIIGISIALAIIINLLAAAIVGTLLPLILRKINIDPALAGGVILTTVTDCMGFLSFLGLATIFYFHAPAWLN
jgi:magnesium transporter